MSNAGRTKRALPLLRDRIVRIPAQQTRTAASVLHGGEMTLPKLGFACSVRPDLSSQCVESGAQLHEQRWETHFPGTSRTIDSNRIARAQIRDTTATAIPGPEVLRIGGSV